MYYLKTLIFLFLICSMDCHAQLGFCTGSKGDAIFSENFGNGTNYGPALPTGTTNYLFVNGVPNDGMYTLFHRTNLYNTWHYSLDHTPDATNGANGKALIVNANASASGEFYKRIVSGLCINTTFEFSAWLMNVYSPLSGYCGASQIPINVRFEIWNDTETVLISSGNTGNVFGSSSPLWQQFALVFTTANETAVILKMKNNGLGGCGNDLAIDDIAFKSCGDLTTISSPTSSGTTFSTCNNSASLQLEATTTGTSNHFYQWQNSTNGTNWIDIVGATASNYTTSNVTVTTYFRTKIAQDAANLGNNFCSTISNVFTIAILSHPASAVSSGDKTICSNETIPALTVTSDSGVAVNWYDSASGGNLLLSNSNSFTPLAAGTYYAETYNKNTNCVSSVRTAVSLTIILQPSVAISGTTAVCSGTSGTINFNGTPNATVTYTFDGSSNQTISLDSNGFASITTPILTTNNITYSLVSVASSVLNTCINNVNNSFTVALNPSVSPTVSGTNSVCYNSNTILTISGSIDGIVSYNIDNGPNQTINLTGGQATISTPAIITNSVYNFTNITYNGAFTCSQPLSISFPINVVSLPTATISANPISICANESSLVSFTGIPNAEISYTVNSNTPETVMLDINGNATISVTNLTTDTTFQLLSASITGVSNCSQSLSDAVTITINSTPMATYTGITTYCSNEIVNLNLLSTIAGTTFDWTVSEIGTSGATSGTGNTINQSIIATSQNDGMVTYFVTPYYHGCAGNTIQIPVTIYPLPKPILSDGTICIPDSNTSITPYLLNTNLNATDYSFQWFFENSLLPNASGSTYDAVQTGSYSAIATQNTTGCVSNEVFANVTETQKGQALLVETSNAFSDNVVVTVNVIGGYGPFLYQLDNGAFQYSNVFENVAAGFHSVTAIDESLCTNLNETVTIIDYPNYFSPNGDGVNDSWNIKGLSTSSKIVIYDRFGKILKQIYSNGSGWDGSYNGEKMLSTDYWFTIEYDENGIKKLFKSHFALKR